MEREFHKLLQGIWSFIRVAPGVAAALVGSRHLTRASNKMQLPIKCIILGSEAVTHRQKDLENPQGSFKDIETHVYCNPVCFFLVFVAFLAHIRSPSLPDVASILVILVVLALRNFTLLLRRLVPPNWLYHKESLLLENYCRVDAAKVCRRRNSLQQQPCSGSAARNSVLFRPFVFVPASVRTYVSTYKRASERPRGERRRDEEVSRSGSILYILLGQFLEGVLKLR